MQDVPHPFIEIGIRHGSFARAAFRAAAFRSVVGMALGASRLPAVWTAPLRDTLEAGIPGLGLMSIADLARRTVEVAARLAEVMRGSPSARG